MKALLSIVTVAAGLGLWAATPAQAADITLASASASGLGVGCTLLPVGHNDVNRIVVGCDFLPWLPRNESNIRGGGGPTTNAGHKEPEPEPEPEPVCKTDFKHW